MPKPAEHTTHLPFTAARPSPPKTTEGGSPWPIALDSALQRELNNLMRATGLKDSRAIMDFVGELLISWWEPQIPSDAYSLSKAERQDSVTLSNGNGLYSHDMSWHVYCRLDKIAKAIGTTPSAMMLIAMHTNRIRTFLRAIPPSRTTARMSGIRNSVVATVNAIDDAEIAREQKAAKKKVSRKKAKTATPATA